MARSSTTTSNGRPSSGRSASSISMRAIRDSDRRQAPRERQRPLRHGGGDYRRAHDGRMAGILQDARYRGDAGQLDRGRHRQPASADVDFFHTVEHPSEGTLRQMRPAATWSDTPLAPGRPAPNLGEHSSEVLSEVGYTVDEVASTCRPQRHQAVSAPDCLDRSR